MAADSRLRVLLGSGLVLKVSGFAEIQAWGSGFRGLGFRV